MLVIRIDCVKPFKTHFIPYIDGYTQRSHNTTYHGKRMLHKGIPLPLCIISFSKRVTFTKASPSCCSSLSHSFSISFSNSFSKRVYLPPMRTSAKVTQRIFQHRRPGWVGEWVGSKRVKRGRRKKKKKEQRKEDRKAEMKRKERKGEKISEKIWSDKMNKWMDQRI